MVGAPLLERGGRQVNLTLLGEEFVQRGQSILAAVDELSDVAQSANDAFSGRLRLGIIPTIAPYLLPSITTQIQANFPTVQLQPREAITSTLVTDLLEHRLDMAVVALPVSEPALEEFALFDEAFVLVRPLKDAEKSPPSQDLLNASRLLLLEEGHCFRDQALSFCALDGTKLHEVMEGNSLSTLVQMVGAGLGLTLIPEMAIALEGRGNTTCIQRFDDIEPKRTIGLVWRRTNPMSAQFASLKDIVVQANALAIAAP